MARNYYNKKYYGKSLDRENLVRNPVLLEVPVPNAYVYILTNKFIPNIYKIGCTNRTSSIRAKELSQDTGVPGQWVVAGDWLVADAYRTEQSLFLEFDAYRIDRSEMFDFKGIRIEDVVKLIDSILSKKQMNLEEYIKKLNEDKAEYEKKKKLDIIRRKEAMQEVNQALIEEQLDTRYICQVREIIDKIYRDDAVTSVARIKKDNVHREIHKYGVLVFGIFLAFLFTIETWFFYSGFLFVLFIIFTNIKDNKEKILTIERENSKYYMQNLPMSLEGLRPIMAMLEMHRVIYIDQLKIHIKVVRPQNSMPNRQHTALETVYKDVNISKSYNGISEKEALIEFMVNIKSR